MQDVIWLILRRMRLPLILLLLVYSLSVIGMTLLPGQTPTGEPYHMNFLEAAYFIAFMATTIGFGEIPYTFTGAQRLFTYLIIFPNVATWLYSVGAIIGLFLEPKFQEVLRHNRFRNRVRRLTEPFWLLCGFGHTGRLVARGLHQRGFRTTVLEVDENKVARMTLNDRAGNRIGLTADARDYHELVAAGLNHPDCRGVIATTDDDHANLKIAISAKLPAHPTAQDAANGKLRVLARCESQTIAANMASFGTDAIVDPFNVFAERLNLLFNNPEAYLVQDWLISVPGTELCEPLRAPHGHWILCGANPFGFRLASVFESLDLPFTLVDRDPNRLAGYEKVVQGRGTEAHTLESAGVGEAVGIIAGTGNDVDNLSIVLTAREMNDKLFTIVRQESAANTPLFDSLAADVVAQRSIITARRLLTLATVPLASAFMDHLTRAELNWVHQLRQSLEKTLAGHVPDLWTLELTGDQARVFDILENEYHSQLKLRHLLTPVRRIDADPLPAICLLHERGAHRTLRPPDTLKLQAGDRLLFAGRRSARTAMRWALAEIHGVVRVVIGRFPPRSAIARHWHGASGRES